MRETEEEGDTAGVTTIRKGRRRGEGRQLITVVVVLIELEQEGWLLVRGGG